MKIEYETGYGVFISTTHREVWITLGHLEGIRWLYHRDEHGIEIIIGSLRIVWSPVPTSPPAQQSD